ncbi:MAG: DUF1919 domain-containing protein [Pasteurellaceae bacterium]|nr:DUF1919 domain-containing protein [Pasteurellaceae bacterium]
MFRLIKKAINLSLRKGINQRNRQRLHNQTPTIIASNCNGAFIAHDLGLQFRSPFVNLYLSSQDFIQYLQHIDDYRNAPLHFIANPNGAYPLAKLNDLTIHFMHYHSEQEAQQKWQQRSQRMDLNNCFLMMTDRDGCTEQDLIAFDQLPYPHKVVFTHKSYPHIQSSYYLADFANQTQVGDLFEFSGWNGKKYYDQFDYVNWFNQSEKNNDI